MKSISCFVLILAACGLVGVAIAQPIGDVEAGRSKSQACVACHGEVGAADNPAFPMLAGQHADYLVYALEAYRSGDRNNAIMNGQAAALSDEDIGDLAAYFSSQNAALYGLRRKSAKSD